MADDTELPFPLVTPLPVALTVSTVEDLAAAFLKQEFQPPAAVLDATALETVTTPGVQLLLSLARTLGAQGISLKITNARPLVAETFAQLGLANEFTAWEA